MGVAVDVGSASGTPRSQGHQGPGTPSSGPLGTPASVSWRTPSGSARRINAFGRFGPLEDFTAGTMEQVRTLSTPSKPPSGSGHTSDESILYPVEEVCLSQARHSPEAQPFGGTENRVDKVIPETLQESEGVLDKILPLAGVVVEDVLDAAIGEDGDKADVDVACEVQTDIEVHRWDSSP